MQKSFLVGIALAIPTLFFIHCTNNAPANAPGHEPATAEATLYACPMNCEKGKTYAQPGSCPVCHMDLEPLQAAVANNTAAYFIDFKANPADLAANQPAILSFTPKIKGNETALVPLDLVHEKKMHLILVSDDLAWFDHIHPEYTATGSYDVQLMAAGTSFDRGHTATRLENGGKYWAFADFKPTGGLNQVEKLELNVAGKPAAPVVYSAEKMRATVDGYTLNLEGKDFKAGESVHIPVRIALSGKPVDAATFENYLGEKAHVIMVEAATKAFVHTHPVVNNGQLDIHTTFAEAGTYKGWLQFQTNGKVHTADFVVKVAGGPHDDHTQDHPHPHRH